MLEKAVDAVKGLKKNKAAPYHETWMDHPIGYPRLSERIALKPETGIYRRFDGLNARHILYLQAELCILERSLLLAEQSDKKDPTGKRSQYATMYETMLEEPSDLDKPQLELIGQMHAKLNEYNKALIQLSVLHQLHFPDRFDLEDIQIFLDSEDMGPRHMRGRDARTWGDHAENNHPPDLIGVHPRKREDTFSRFVAEKGVHLFKCGLGRFTTGNRHLGRRVYYDSTVLKLTFILTSAMAALIPVASILVLLQLKSRTAKMCAIAAFNVLISVILTFFTDAKRTDVFSVNAAFTAVQVVFIGTNQGS